MLSDRQENPVSGATAEAVEHFDAAVRAFNVYRGDPVALVDNAAGFGNSRTVIPLNRGQRFH
jgi:hypothetical protein